MRSSAHQPCICHMRRHPLKVFASQVTLDRPEDVTLRALHASRRASPYDQTFRALLIPGSSSGVHSVGDMVLKESGPLANCSHILDTSARRVLPGNILRRCRVLSSLTLGEDCLQRVAITSCTGEEITLKFHLKDQGETEQRWEGPRSSRWLISSVKSLIEDEECSPLPPHPRISPENVIFMQLQALRGGNIKLAHRYNLTSCLRREPSEQRRDLNAYQELLRLPANLTMNFLRGKAKIETSALPSMRTYAGLVEVDNSKFMFELGMTHTGIWAVEAVRRLH